MMTQAQMKERQHADTDKHHWEVKERHEEINRQEANLPRKAPRDTLPMPVANIQEHKRAAETVRDRLAVTTGTDRRKHKSTEPKPKLLHSIRISVTLD